MIILIYILIVLFATTVGATTGLGGGIIIKPLLDVVGFHSVDEIGFFSSVAVFSMCVISLYKQLRRKTEFNKNIVYSLSFGSVIGGFLGEYAFQFIFNIWNNQQVKAVQASVLLITLLVIFYYTLVSNRIKSLQVKSKIGSVLIGLFLGMISVFLGIGGGPLNVSMLMFCFSFPIREAAFYSLATIFFSQLSKLGISVLGGSFITYDLKMIPFLIITAIIGGLIGTKLNQSLSIKRIEQLYSLLIIFLILLSAYNVIVNIL
ncbi:sulfite exporter TauE/SafE family protein [Streptococcus zalophi]|uniref:Probable membrane transporter protein n=1 Tax=Streptococcus zalophi TaxID=640031 RepID=A0A934P9H1_9STRE|nr:sulfite exporter TauE/SafE family protein [Streptococcus zalophi]MBJ8349646.1 sulfite exporter TauE/SafE family protein [Streptococcus zalophi]MCR8968005.1 sulfite exporter TauE/SafE family protein [Streptococcus zalophi]